MQSKIKMIPQSNLLVNIKEFSSLKWKSLSEEQKKLALGVWKLITYKWKWQIAINSPFLLIWILDKTIPSVHEFDMKLLSSLPIPNWLGMLMGLS